MSRVAAGIVTLAPPDGTPGNRAPGQGGPRDLGDAGVGAAWLARRARRGAPPNASSNALRLVPLTLRAANAFVARHHRHAGPTRGMKFALGTEQAGRLVGVAIVGRPLARALDDGATLEVLRLCTVGAPNACSFLYGAARRAARALGHRRLVTYTLAGEPGTSLRAAGWRLAARVPAASWDRPGRPRVDRHELRERRRWEITL